MQSIISLRRITYVVVLIIYFTYFQSNAQYFTPSISLATGNSGLASVDGVETLFLNPASMAHMQGFQTGVLYSGGHKASGSAQSGYTLAFADNTEGVLIPGGFSYTQQKRHFSGFYGVEETIWNVSLARFLGKQVSFGVTGLYFEQKDLETGTIHRSPNGSVGILWNPAPDWAVGVVYSQFAKYSGALPDHLHWDPELALGVSMIMQKISRFRVDISQAQEHNPKFQFKSSVGAETYVNEYSVIRMGFNDDDRADRQYWSVGWGFAGPRLRFNYSYQKNVKGAPGGMHSVDMNIGL